MDKQGKIRVIAEILAKISAAYQNFQANEYTPEVWIEGLQGLRLDDINKALILHIRENVFPPTVADIRLRAEEMRAERSREIARARKLQIQNQEMKLIEFPKEQAIENKQKVRALLSNCVRELKNKNKVAGE